ncbi:MAG TPA: winged helix-turn-helix domain-containing protein [Gemmatimonadaceae bacterium]|jgi:DNA-binding transcriptional ArsR family regulator|nr:winged helix-turn-helix domain-containing protein [Gemmatimonadaceae bacterium]
MDVAADIAPDVATVASLVGDRARAAILVSLMDGRALTATELARAAGVTKQTASSHLAKLANARLVSVASVGRHRYFRLADHDVGSLIEDLARLATRVGVTHVRSGPPDPALRKARVCYDHLAGDLGVLVFDSLRQRKLVHAAGTAVSLTAHGELFCDALGLDVRHVAGGRRPLCLACLDWSARRHHLAGALGALLLDRFISLGWARHRAESRIILFSTHGEIALRARFPVR